MKEEYLEIAKNNVQIFGMPWWLDILCEGNWDALVLKDTNGTILWPYHIKKIGLWQTITVPQVTLFQGPYCIGVPEDQTWNGAFSHFKSFAEFHYQSAPNWKPNPKWNLDSFARITRTHYELNPDSNWRSSYNKLTLRKLKKASKDFSVVEASDLNGFFDITKLSYAAQGVTVPFSQEVMHSLFMEALNRGVCKVLESYSNDGKLASCIWLVWDDQYVYYFLSGMDRSIPNNSSVVGLVDHAIEFTLKSNKIFNFYGSEVSGVARFMQGFGAQPAFSTYLTSQNSTTLKLLRSASRIVK
jgi:hypothetical protein